MDAETVFNRYDIRGTYPDEIDEAFAERLGKSAGTYAVRDERGRVVVGRDTRDASRAVYDSFINGVRATGANVIDVGVSTTDRTALAGTHYGGIAVMVTASHHAWERTGFKFIHEQGNGFTNQDLDVVKQLFHEQSFETGDGTLLQVQHEFDETYIEQVAAGFREFIDGIDATAVLDAVGGAERTSALLFEELGATIVPVERETLPAPEPSAEHRADVIELLKQQDADIVVGYDPDGDRVYVVHPELGWIDGDRLFYALAQIVRPDQIVASLDTSPIIEQVGAPVAYTRVGDIFVAEKGMDLDADLLGEPNGHYAVTDFCWYNSGIFASLLLAAHHAELPELLAPVAAYRTERAVKLFDSVEARDDAMNSIIQQVAQRYDVVSTSDGIKFEADGVTGLVRPSGTSPKVRLITHFKAGQEERAKQVAEQLI